jgi:hypothetical protein
MTARSQGMIHRRHEIIPGPEIPHLERCRISRIFQSRGNPRRPIFVFAAVGDKEIHSIVRLSSLLFTGKTLSDHARAHHEIRVLLAAWGHPQTPLPGKTLTPGLLMTT